MGLHCASRYPCSALSRKALSYDFNSVITFDLGYSRSEDDFQPDIVVILKALHIDHIIIISYILVGIKYSFDQSVILIAGFLMLSNSGYTCTPVIGSFVMRSY